MKLKKTTTVYVLKWTNCILICFLAVLISGCASIEKVQTYYKNRKVAVLQSPTGKTTRIISNSKKVISRAPNISNIRYNNNLSVCNVDKIIDENTELKREEISFELSFMINSLNHQTPSKENGRNFRRLSRNMVTNLYNTPDCKPFRYKLHVVNKLLEGYSLKSMQN